MTKSEKINLGFTIGGPALLAVLIGWGIWSINARLTIERQSEDEFNARTYVSQTWYEANYDATNAKIDALSSRLGAVQNDVSEIKGELKQARPAPN